MFKGKVFCLGFQKTGTTSLGLALEHLGFSVCGYHPFRKFANDPNFNYAQVIEHALKTAENFTAFQDTPWPILYKELDRSFPGSKFIHVHRDPTKWIASTVNDFGKTPNMIHNHIYGKPYPQGNEDFYISRYLQHNKDVVEYFQDRPDSFRSLCLDDGEVCWAAICDFLGYPIPDHQWPKANTARSKKAKGRYYRIRNKISRFFKATQ